jgi:hypothetical protein
MHVFVRNRYLCRVLRVLGIVARSEDWPVFVWDNRVYLLRRVIYITAILLLLGGAAPFSGVELDYFQIDNEGQEFVVSWKSVVEEDVYAYELTRRTGLSANDEFSDVFTAPAHGPDKAYTFRDAQVYKTGSEKLDYRLQVVYASGLREVIMTKSVNYTSTAVRRTWGSLKAMFQ